VHALQADHVPPLQVRVWVPQSPHACEDDPVQAHWPATQEEPPGQTVPQPPQLLPSVCSSTQLLAQRASPPLQVQAPHWQLPLHVCDPLVSQVCVAAGAHAPWPVHVPHADQVPPLQVRLWVPQFPQACVVAPLHAHWPLVHVEPAGQVVPHAPQLALSESSSTQVPPQDESPALHAQAPHWQVPAHDCDPLPWQACVAPGAHAPCPAQAAQADHVPALQVRVWVPQLPHACEVGPLQPHCPAVQVDPDGHTVPHAPQLFASVCSSTHAPEQAE
jgi:hypothetical protein